MLKVSQCSDPSVLLIVPLRLRHQLSTVTAVMALLVEVMRDGSLYFTRSSRRTRLLWTRLTSVQFMIKFPIGPTLAKAFKAFYEG